MMLSGEFWSASLSGWAPKRLRPGGAQPVQLTLYLPDALIGATALIASILFYTCNPLRYPMPELDLRPIVIV